MSDQPLPGKVIYQSDSLTARFVEGNTARVVVCFPDRVHPVGFDQPGWAEGFLTRRGVSAIYISVARIDWFQCADFFVAMAACRAHLSADRPVTTYGSSMGGYAAILAAQTLNADLCLALSPQYSIDPEIVPFERRYNDHAAQIGRFRHDLANHVSDTCTYVVGLDPTHGLDLRHLKLVERAFAVRRLPVYGAGHGVLPMLIAGDARQSLAGFLSGQISLGGLRCAIRAERRGSGGYRRRMGKKAVDKGHGRLAGLDPKMPTRRHLGSQNAKPKLVVHCGLPKTGTTSLQAYFFANAKAYQSAGIFYPTEGADPKDRNHAWLSRQLRDASVGDLTRALASCPDSCHTIFLSDESLFVERPGLSDAALSALTEALEGYEVEIVLFERDLVPWMRSFYLQSVQNRRAGQATRHPTARNLWQTPMEYSAFFEQPYCQALLDFPAMRASLSAAFGASSVRVLGFEKGKDVVPSFCEAMGWPQPAKGVTLDRNPSITDAEAEILRQANAMKDGQARFVKTLIGLPDEFDPAKMKPQRLQKLTKQARRFPWAKFSFQPNPPLQVTRADFDTTKSALETRAGRLGAVKQIP